MGAGAAPGEAHQGPPGVAVPIGGAQAREGRYQIHVPVIRNGEAQGLRFRRVFDELQLIPEPLYGASRVEHAALQAAAGLLPQPPGHAGDQTVFAPHAAFSRIHYGEAAGAVGVLGIPGMDASLSQQGGLLVSRRPADGDARQLLQTRYARCHPAVFPGVGNRQGEHIHGQLQLPAQVPVPVQGVDIEYHGAACVGAVRHMGLAAGEVPDEPGFHGAEQQLSPLRLLRRSGHVFQDPPELGAGEIGVDQKAGALLHQGSQSPGGQLVAVVRCAAALPDDGVAHRPPRVPVPDDGGLPLIGNADGGNIPGGKAALLKGLPQGLELGLEDLHGIMLHPSGPGIDLGKGVLGNGRYASHTVEHNGSGAGSALVQSNYIGIHGNLLAFSL